MTSPLDPPFLLLYASIGGAIWFAIAARRRGCIATLTVVATISFFNGMLIAAIKVLPEHVANDPDLKQRFEREAQIPPSDLTAAMPNRLVLGSRCMSMLPRKCALSAIATVGDPMSPSTLPFSRVSTFSVAVMLPTT